MTVWNPSVPLAANQVSQGTSPTFPMKPLATVATKLPLPPIPNGWQYIGGPVLDVRKIPGLPEGLRFVRKPDSVTKIDYSAVGAITKYAQAPNGDIYAALIAKIPKTVYEGDIKRTVRVAVTWGYRWVGQSGAVSTGGGAPINTSLVSGGGNAETQVPTAPPINIPGIGAGGSTGGTPAGDGPIYHGWDESDYYEPGREYGPSAAKPNYLLYAGIGLGVLAATMLIWRNA